MHHQHLETTERGPKLAIMDITSSTNTRTLIASPVAGIPCGNSIGVLTCSPVDCLTLSAVLNSFAYDFALRIRFSGLHTNWFIIEETPLPQISSKKINHYIPRLSAFLSIARPFLGRFPIFLAGSPKRAMTDHERLRIRIVLDVLVAATFGLGLRELQYVLHDCDFPRQEIAGAQLSSKGFWRVDKKTDPELRHTVLTLIAFQDLESKIQAAGGDIESGIKAFLAQNRDEGWMLPESIRLADYGLGHDERAQHPQPVASRLGPRFYDWQLVQSADESWRECHLHARNLLGAREYRFQISASSEGLAGDSLPLVADRSVGYGESDRGQRSLFAPRTEM